jgi:hypothetical protein
VTNLITGIYSDGTTSLEKPIAVDVDGKIKTLATSLDQSEAWTTIRTFNANTNPDGLNAAPTNPTATSPNVTNENADYQALLGFSPTNSNKLQVLPRLKTTPGYTARVYPWIWDGFNDVALPGIAVLPKDNGISFSDSNGFLSGNPKQIYTLSQYNAGLRVGARVTLLPLSSVFSLPVSNTVPNVTQAAITNPGYQGGELVTFNTTGTLPFGLAAFVSSFNSSNNTLTLDGASFSDAEPVRFNFVSLGANAIPPLGIAARIQPSGVSTKTGTLTLDGSQTDLVLSAGDSIRFRNAPGSTLPGGITNATTYVIRSVSGSPGSQTFILTNADGITPLIPTSIGAGYFYIFRYPYQPLFFKGTNQLSYNSGESAISFPSDYNSIPVWLTGNTIATFTSTAHGFTANQAVTLTGTTAPGGMTLGATYYIYGPSLAANTFQLSFTPGGLPFPATSIGSSVVVGGKACTVSATTPVASVFTFSAHGFTNGQALILGGTTAPGGGVLGNTYYVRNATANTFELAQISGGLSCAFTSTGSNVTVKASGGSPIVVAVTAAVQQQITLVNHYFGATQQFNLPAATGTSDYTLGNSLFVVSNSLTATTFQFSDFVGGAPVIIPGTAITGVALSAAFSNTYYPFTLEKTQAYIKSPADSTVGFSNTSGGAAIVLYGGSGTHTITPANAGQILSGSQILARVSS